MTQPLGGYGRDPYAQYSNWSESEGPVNKAARDYCTHADSVVSGFLCGEDQVISDACRAGKTETDRTLCDDKKLQAAQSGVVDTVKDVLKTIVSVMIGRAGK